MRKENKERILTICPNEVPAPSSIPRHERSECREKIFYTQFVTLLWAGFTFLLRNLSFWNTELRVKGSLENTGVYIQVLSPRRGATSGQGPGLPRVSEQTLSCTGTEHGLSSFNNLCLLNHKVKIHNTKYYVCFLSWKIKVLNQVTCKVFSSSDHLCGKA